MDFDPRALPCFKTTWRHQEAPCLDRAALQLPFLFVHQGPLRVTWDGLTARPLVGDCAGGIKVCHMGTTTGTQRHISLARWRGWHIPTLSLVNVGREHPTKFPWSFQRAESLTILLSSQWLYTEQSNVLAAVTPPTPPPPRRPPPPRPPRPPPCRGAHTDPLLRGIVWQGDYGAYGTFSRQLSPIPLHGTPLCDRYQFHLWFLACITDL